MKKNVTEILLLVFFVFTGAVTYSAWGYSEVDPMVLKCGLSSPPTEDESRTVTMLGNVVQKRTNGRLQFKFFYGSSLIKKPQLFEGVARGIADISVGPISFVAGKVPAVSIFEVYGCYKLDRFDEMEKAVNPLLTNLFEKYGVHHVGAFNPGPTLFLHKTKFLKTPDDWKGQKMRLGGRWQSSLAQKWGASPVFMPPPELYLALQRGVIDGFTLPWSLVDGFKLYEVAPYITQTNLGNMLGIITMNLDKWKALTKTDQEIFNKAAEEVLIWTSLETLISHDNAREMAISKGAKVYDLNPAENRLYSESSYEIWPEVRKVSGPIGNELCDIMENYREK